MDYRKRIKADKDKKRFEREVEELREAKVARKPKDSLYWFLVGIERRRDEALHQTRMKHNLESFTLTDACRLSGENINSMRRVTTRGNPTVLSVIRLARTIAVTAEWLLSGDLNEIEWDSTIMIWGNKEQPGVVQRFGV